MKQINSFKVVCVIGVFLLLMAACKKGDTGPAGPAGVAGPTGAAGAAGPKGDTGTANVIYSAWLDVAFTLNTAGTAYGGSIAAPKLDANMLAKGEIKVYMNLDLASSPLVVPLPYYDGQDILNLAFELQKIDLVATYDFSTGLDGASNQKYQQFRYILIPGGKAARSAIDWNDYAAVKKYLNLKD